jgi:integrase
MQHLQTSDEPPRTSTVRMYNAYLDGHLYPAFGDRPIATITRKDAFDALDTVKKKSGVASALGAKSLLGAVLNWAAAREIISVNPAAGIKAKDLVGRVARARDRALKDGELAAVWRAIPAVGDPFGSIYKLLLLTGCRLAEISALKWDSEVDLDKGVLAIPAERTKNGVPMVVPLPPLAVNILKEMKRQVGSYVFSTTAGRRPVSAYSHAKARLDAALKAAGAKVEPFVIHDLRRTFRTGLTKLGVTRDVAEECLGHKKPGIIETYDKHDYLPEKANALRLWEAHLLSIVEPPDPDEAGKVVPIRRARA